jgi:hypothetical protein
MNLPNGTLDCNVLNVLQKYANDAHGIGISGFKK